MVKFIHLADLHLGASPAYLGAYANERANDFLDAFTRSIDYAIAEINKIDFVVISGDLFDSPTPKDELVSKVVFHFNRLRKANIPVVLAPGNHDALGFPHCIYLNDRYKIHDLINLITSPNTAHQFSMQFGDEIVNIYGMAWDYVNSKPPFDEFDLVCNDGYQIAVIHGTISGVTFSELHSREVPLDLKKLSKIGLDYIALGHIHSNIIYDQPGIFAVYPGTLEGRRFAANEVGDRYLCVVTLEKNEKPKLEKIKWNKKHLLTITINLNQEAVESDEDIIALIRKKYSGQEKIIRLKIIGDTSFVIDIDKVLVAVQNDFSWITIVDETSLFDSTIIETWKHEDTIRGAYIRTINNFYESSTSESEKNLILRALKLGISAFQKSVKA